ncbi:MAG: hypothetical protein QOK19_2642 [Solirubrobacteraceae bacterium]|jgi:hypothetical protein|nr:hypothetical protein [Solirubrobacteraceae bacterium]
MLFDLRGRGRRRTVKVLYIGLALLIGVGLVGFGVGGGLGGGGILNATNNNEGSGGASFASKIKKYEKLTRTQPSNPANWEQLAKNLLHEAGNEGYTSSTGAPTSKGKQIYRRASEAWVGYLALNPPNPNPELAQLVYVIYSEAGLNEPAKAVQALNYVVERRPTAAYYAQLAEFAYKAKNVRLGDLAASKAVSLAPSNERARVKNELAEVKKFPNGGQTYVTTTNGKTYRVKKAPDGSYTQVAPPTSTPAATGTASTPTTTK